MTLGRWTSFMRKWVGFVSGVAVVVSSLLLLSVYVHYRIEFPKEKALVDSLKEQARTDPDVQGVLQPETARQHELAVARRTAYDRGALILLVSAVAFLAWLKWLRPASSGHCRQNQGKSLNPRRRHLSYLFRRPTGRNAVGIGNPSPSISGRWMKLSP